MKKLKFFMLSILVIFGVAVFSACKKEEIKVESVDVSDTNVSLRTGERVELDVVITPAEATNKQFKIIGDYADVVTIQADCSNMKIILLANNEIIPGKENATIAVRTEDGSHDKIISISLTNEENVAIPQNLSFNGQYLSWDEVDRAVKYTLLINGEEKMPSDHRYLLDLNQYANQNVSVQVKARGKSRNLDSEYSEAINFFVFPKPLNVQLTVQPSTGANPERKILFWDAVDGADSYSVLINNKLVDSNTNSLDITSYVADPVQYAIKVRANSIVVQNKYNSAYTDALNVESLSSPDNLTISNGVLRWNTVTSANVKYAVWYTYAKNGVLDEKVYTTTNTYWTLPFDIDVGEYSARVGAIGDGVNTLSSEYGEVIKFTKLDSVKNIRIEDGSIVWNKVEKANSYIVYYKNITDESGQVITDERVVQLSDADKIAYIIPDELGAGEFRINVQAVGQEDKIPSNLMENDFVAFKLAKPTGIQVLRDENNKSVIIWKRVNNASGYQVKVERPDDTEYTNIFNIAQSNDEFIVANNIPNMFESGNYIITITALGGKIGNITYLSSNKSDRIEISKLLSPNLLTTRLKDGVLAWDRVANAGSYSVLVKSAGNDDVLHTVTTTNIDLNSVDYHVDSGVYQIYVKANATNNQNFLDSEYCQYIVINKLSTKSVVVKNGTVQNLEVDEEENYQYKYKIVDEKGRKSSVSDVQDYIDNTIASGIKASIQVVAIPKYTEITQDEQKVYYVKSDISSAIYVRKLPTIKDLAIADGFLHFGADYIDLYGYEFIIYVNSADDTQTVNLGTDRVYDFNNIMAGNYTVKARAMSIEADDETVHDENHPYNLNSQISTEYSFKKLATPENFTISSFADNQTYLYQALSSANDYVVKSSGALVWNRVNDAINYELKFNDDIGSLYTSNTYHTLQNTSILAGSGKSVRIKAHGNGTNIISSDYSTKTITFTKLCAPDIISLSVDEQGKKIVNWAYSDSSKNPNEGFSLLSLKNNDCTLAMFIFVEKVGSNIVYYPATTGLSSITSNKCELPEGLSGNSTLRLLAVPFNTCITNLSPTDITSSAIAKVTDSALQIVSDYSPELSLERLQKPLNLKLENQNPEDLETSKNILSWSKLDYEEGILDEYRITINAAKTNSEEEKKYVFSISTHNTSFPTIIVDDLSKASNCQWEFNKTNFESLFGEGAYVPNVYSVSIQAISQMGAKYNVGDRVVYYIDSFKSTAVVIEVLATPDISVIKGTVSWEKIQNANSYGLTLILPDHTKKYLIVKKEDTTISLQSDELNSYPAGEYFMDIVALGNGKSTISSESRNQVDYRRLVKLEKVEDLQIANGIITYSNHSIVDSAEGENCIFTLSIRSSRTNAKPVEEANEKLHSFELADENKYPGALTYNVAVRASGDNRLYINSDFTEEISGYKFATPSGMKVVDGKLTWTRVSGITKYLINVSGGEHDFNSTEITNSYKFDGIEGGTYRVEIKAIGDNLSFNSSVAVMNNVEKLAGIEDFELYTGYLKWKFASGSNYKLVIDGTREIIISNSDAEIINILGENYVKYKLSDIQLDGSEHTVYVYNYGGNTKISSLATEVIKIKKLSSPTGLTVDKETFKFKTVDNAENYAVRVELAISETATKEYVYIPDSVDVYGVDATDSTYRTIEFSALRLSVLEGLGLSTDTPIKSYTISVYAIGNSVASLNDFDTYFISSNDSTSLKIEQPGATKLYFETGTGLVQKASDGTFYGKIVWNRVDDADYYKVYVSASMDAHKVLFGFSLNQPIEDINSDYYNYACYIIPDKERTYANIIYCDSSYSFVVVACKNKNGFDSIGSNKLTNLDYSIYNASQDGLTEQTAYQIANETEFGYIKYNLEAHYKLTADIAFERVPETIGLNIPFTGVFDGDNYTLQGKSGDSAVNLNIDTDSFDGLFGVIGESGIVKNIVFNADIYSNKITNNVINIAYIARENKGTIYNVKTTGEIGTVYNSDTYMICASGIAIYNYGTIDYCLSTASISAKNERKDVYAAGIAVYNYGTISKSGFKGDATGQIVGGIAGQNYGIITQCYYEADTEGKGILSKNNGVIDNFAGGIAAYMQGENSLIEYCYSYGKITSTTNSSKSAYAGGLVGYLKSGTLKNSYAIGCKNNQLIIDATGLELDTAHSGVVVGATEVRNNYGAKVVYVKLSTQKVSGSGTLNNTEEASVNNLSNALRSLNSIFDTNSTYPKLKNAKKN
ncbi:MAG TPA: hypothetical protein DCO89_02770 [Clostridiales bacterium]|nr:hypothetical protein [Clostridiales bacterium]